MLLTNKNFNFLFQKYKSNLIYVKKLATNNLNFLWRTH